MTEKEIALAMSFDDAPAEVKEPATALKDAYLRVEKAEAQFQLWNEERDSAKKELQKQLKVFNRAIEKWDPAQIKKAKKEDKT